MAALNGGEESTVDYAVQPDALRDERKRFLTRYEAYMYARERSLFERERTWHVLTWAAPVGEWFVTTSYEGGREVVA